MLRMLCKRGEFELVLSMIGQPTEVPVNYIYMMSLMIIV